MGLFPVHLNREPWVPVLRLKIALAWPIWLASEVYSKFASHISEPLDTLMSDPFADDVLYLTPFWAKTKSTVVPRAQAGSFPIGGAWIRSRSYVQPGTARFVFEFPVTSASRFIVRWSLWDFNSRRLRITCSPNSAAALQCLRSVHEDASGRGWRDPGRCYTLHLFARIIKVQLQIWMVKDEELQTQLDAIQCFAA